jgi:hypothetical protein
MNYLNVGIGCLLKFYLGGRVPKLISLGPGDFNS